MKSFMSKSGTKLDQGKARWDLLPLEQVEKGVEVLSYGAEVHGDNNWKKVKNGSNRYYAALMRHLKDWRAGVKKDEDTGKSPLSHAFCCLIFMMWFDDQKEKKNAQRKTK